MDVDSLPSPRIDESFVNVWLDDDDDPAEAAKKNFYKSWVHQASAKHSDPGLIGAHRLRKLYPEHSLVSTRAYDLNILGFPGLSATPLPSTPLIADVLFMPLGRSTDSVPGVLIDQVKFGAFKIVWKGYEFLLYTASYPFGLGGIITQSYILHEGPEERSRLLLLAIGAWSHELHDEIWVFNQGFWNKDRGLWQEIQKANWDDVILKENFKKALHKDVYGFFSAKEVYEKLSIPWKRGLILHGPPGNGKTISVKAIMKSCSDNGFVPLYVKSFQSWKGEEGAMADVFNQARQVSPACLILEDLDSLINDRNRSYFLNQLDGLDSNNGLLIIGTTNHFDRLDPGLSSRPSRFDRKYLFDDPDDEERALYAKYWQKKLSDNREIYFPDTLVRSVVELTTGFSFAYLKEAFVSTLVTLAGIAGDKPRFGDLLEDQIRDLRKQLDDNKPRNDNTGKSIDRFVESLSPTQSPEVAKGSRDVRILLDALNDRISQGNPRDKIYSMLQHIEPSGFELDADARRVRLLLDSLSDSVANMSLSSRVDRHCVPPHLRRNAIPADGLGMLDGVYSRVSQANSQSAAGNRSFQRQLPTPPGPPGVPWVLTRPAPPGAFVQQQPLQDRPNTCDASDLA